MTTVQSAKRRRVQACPRNSKCYFTLFIGLLGLYVVSSYETQYENWEGEVFMPLLCQSSRFCIRIFSNVKVAHSICETSDAPASTEEFDHDNDPEVCGLPILTVEEWEAGRYWEGKKPVIVKNVTAGWAAMEHWKK